MAYQGGYATGFQNPTAGATQDLAGTTAGTSTVAGALDVAAGGVAHALAGSTAGVSTTTGALAVAVPLAGTSAGASTVTGTAAVDRPLAGAPAGNSTTTGALTVVTTHALAGATSGASTATGALGVVQSLAGSTGGTSATTGTIGAVLAVAGTIAGQSTATGALGATLGLSGAAAGQSSGSGTLAVAYTLAGAAAGTSTVTGATGSLQALAGTAAGTSTVGGAGGAPVPWSPDQLSGLEVWLKADALALVDGAAVDTWADASGNGADAVKGTFAAPTLETNELGGLPVVRFTAAAGQALRVVHTVDLPYTVLVLGRLTGGTNGRLFGSIYPDARNWLVGWWNGTQDSLYAEGFVNSGGSATANWRQYSAYGDGAAPTGFYGDGTLIAENTSGMQGPNGRFALSGYAPASGEELSDGELAEVVVFDRVLSTLERQQVEGYLAHKWARAAVLPSAHPFKAAAPAGTGGGGGVVEFNVDRGLAGVAGATSTVTGAMEVAHSLAGTAAGHSQVAAGLEGHWSLLGATGGASGASAELVVERGLVATATGTSSASGELGLTSPLAGVAAGHSGASAALDTAKGFAGTATGQSSASGTLVVSHPAAGATGAQSSTSGALSVARPLAGVAAGHSALAPYDLAVSRALDGRVVGTSTALAAILDVVRTLEGRSDGVSTVTGDLEALLGGIGVVHPVITVGASVYRVITPAPVGSGARAGPSRNGVAAGRSETDAETDDSRTFVEVS